MNTGDVSSRSTIVAGDSRSTAIDTRPGEDLYAAWNATWDATWQAMSGETPRPLAEQRPSSPSRDENRRTERAATAAPRSETADLPGSAERHVKPSTGPAEPSTPHTRMFVSGSDQPALPTERLSAPAPFQTGATGVHAIRPLRGERAGAVCEVTRDRNISSQRATEEWAPECVTIVAEDGAISIVVRDTAISDRRALESALAVASELRGTPRALRRLTLNGHIIYQLDADSTADRRRDPAVLFSC